MNKFEQFHKIGALLFGFAIWVGREWGQCFKSTVVNNEYKMTAMSKSDEGAITISDPPPIGIMAHLI